MRRTFFTIPLRSGWRDERLKGHEGVVTRFVPRQMLDAPGLKTMDRQHHVCRIKRMNEMGDDARPLASLRRSSVSHPLYIQGTCDPIVYLDVLFVKMRHEGRVVNRAVYIAVGVKMDGFKDVLGLWTSATEGAKLWLTILTELRTQNSAHRPKFPTPPKLPASRTCRSLFHGSRRLPGLADRHLTEAAGFPDLPIVISRKPPVSRICRSSSYGNRRFPGLTDRHLTEAVRFPDLPIVISRKPPVSRICRSSSHGNRRLPGLADRHFRETTGFPDLTIVMWFIPPS